MNFTYFCYDKYASKQEKDDGWGYGAGDYGHPSRRAAKSEIKQDSEQLRKSEEADQHQESPRNDE
ncbi:MAG TPA: hypothetical protein VLB46_05010 [Pyrinomonadaceae bacterium]|nr:hypothetical protein [Pyrinomonadaceae bacterium]